MSATVFYRNKAIDNLTGVATYVSPTLYLALLTADPTDSGSLASEVTAGGYSRLSLAGILGAASGGISVNTSLITIGPATASWGTITFLGIMDALTDGNMIIPGVPTTPRTINVGQPFQIPVGQMRLRLT